MPTELVMRILQRSWNLVNRTHKMIDLLWHYLICIKVERVAAP